MTTRNRTERKDREVFVCFFGYRFFVFSVLFWFGLVSLFSCVFWSMENGGEIFVRRSSSALDASPAFHLARYDASYTKRFGTPMDVKAFEHLLYGFSSDI